VGFRSRSAAGVLRYYIRAAESLCGPINPKKLMRDLPRPEDRRRSIDPPRPISVTFIPAKVFDNPVLLRVKPRIFHLAGRHIAATVRDGPPARIHGLIRPRETRDMISPSRVPQTGFRTAPAGISPWVTYLERANEQLAGERDDRDAADPAALGANALTEPNS